MSLTIHSNMQSKHVITHELPQFVQTADLSRKSQLEINLGGKGSIKISLGFEEFNLRAHPGFQNLEYLYPISRLPYEGLYQPQVFSPFDKTVYECEEHTHCLWPEHLQVINYRFPDHNMMMMSFSEKLPYCFAYRQYETALNCKNITLLREVPLPQNELTRVEVSISGLDHPCHTNFAKKIADIVFKALKGKYGIS